MATGEVASQALVVLAMTLLLTPAAAVFAWNSYRRWRLRSPGILFLTGLGITLAGFVVLAVSARSLNSDFMPAFQLRLSAAFLLFGAGISDMAISLYLAHVYAKAIKSGPEPVPSLREGPRRLRSRR